MKAFAVIICACLYWTLGNGAYASSPKDTKAEMAAIINRVGPSIVKVYTKRPAHTPSGERHSNGAPVFLPVSEVSLGFIIDAKRGYILTAKRVLTAGQSITVKFSDGTQENAQLVHGTVLGLIKVNTHKLPALKIGDSNSVRKRDQVLVTNNLPVTADSILPGTVFSTTWKAPWTAPFDPKSEHILVETMVRKEMSFGPVFDLSGRVVGLNEIEINLQQEPSQLTRAALSVMPINRVKKLLSDLEARQADHH